MRKRIHVFLKSPMESQDGSSSEDLTSLMEETFRKECKLWLATYAEKLYSIEWKGWQAKEERKRVREATEAEKPQKKLKRENATVSDKFKPPRTEPKGRFGGASCG